MKETSLFLLSVTLFWWSVLVAYCCACRRNTHGVTLDKIRRMLGRYQRHLSLSDIMSANAPDGHQSNKGSTQSSLLRQQAAEPPHRSPVRAPKASSHYSGVTSGVATSGSPSSSQRSSSIAATSGRGGVDYHQHPSIPDPVSLSGNGSSAVTQTDVQAEGLSLRSSQPAAVKLSGPIGHLSATAQPMTVQYDNFETASASPDGVFNRHAVGGTASVGLEQNAGNSDNGGPVSHASASVHSIGDLLANKPSCLSPTIKSPATSSEVKVYDVTVEDRRKDLDEQVPQRHGQALPQTAGGLDVHQLLSTRNSAEMQLAEEQRASGMPIRLSSELGSASARAQPENVRQLQLSSASASKNEVLDSDTASTRSHSSWQGSSSSGSEDQAVAPEFASSLDASSSPPGSGKNENLFESHVAESRREGLTSSLPPMTLHSATSTPNPVRLAPHFSQPRRPPGTRLPARPLQHCISSSGTDLPGGALHDEDHSVTWAEGCSEAIPSSQALLVNAPAENSGALIAPNSGILVSGDIGFDSDDIYCSDSSAAEECDVARTPSSAEHFLDSVESVRKTDSELPGLLQRSVSYPAVEVTGIDLEDAAENAILSRVGGGQQADMSKFFYNSLLETASVGGDSVSSQENADSEQVGACVASSLDDESGDGVVDEDDCPEATLPDPEKLCKNAQETSKILFLMEALPHYSVVELVAALRENDGDAQRAVFKLLDCDARAAGESDLSVSTSASEASHCLAHPVDLSSPSNVIDLCQGLSSSSPENCVEVVPVNSEDEDEVCVVPSRSHGRAASEDAALARRLHEKWNTSASPAVLDVQADFNRATATALKSTLDEDGLPSFIMNDNLAMQLQQAYGEVDFGKCAVESPSTNHLFMYLVIWFVIQGICSVLL